MEKRLLCDIAKDIKATWKPVWFGAVPYLEALGELRFIEETYHADSARYVVTGFLGNAQTWRGADARRIKAELKSIAGLR